MFTKKQIDKLMKKRIERGTWVPTSKSIPRSKKKNI